MKSFNEFINEGADKQLIKGIQTVNPKMSKKEVDAFAKKLMDNKAKRVSDDRLLTKYNELVKLGS